MAAQAIRNGKSVGEIIKELLIIHDFIEVSMRFSNILKYIRYYYALNAFWFILFNKADSNMSIKKNCNIIFLTDLKFAVIII